MTAAPASLRVGVVGAGANTRLHHIPKLQAIDGVTVVSVCNRSRESGERVAAEFNIPQVYDNWEQLVAADDSDAIVIGTWPYLHGPVTIAALDAGKHVLTEARMAMNLAEARRMLAAATRHPELVAQVVPSPFTLGVDTTLRRLVDSGYLGTLRAVEVRASTGFLAAQAGTPLGWREDPGLSGQNIMTLGIWYEALMRWVGEATAVMARGKVFTADRSIPEHLDVIADLARDGAQLHMLVSAAAGLAGHAEAWIFGSQGTVRFSNGILSGGQPGDDQLQPIAIPAEETGGWRVEEEFVGAIRGTEPVRHTTFAAGVRYMAFTDAVHRSLAENRLIEIESG